MNLLITGGCGFIGSHTIKKLMARKNLKRLVNIDLLTYSGHPENLIEIENDERYTFVHGSINDRDLIMNILLEYDIDVVVNLAAESHVDRSIDSVKAFIDSNIDGTRNILECIRDNTNSKKEVCLVHISTDEVYGSLGKNDPPFNEETPINPRNPYAVTKASSDMLVQSFVNTYNLKACITRCSNNYGPNQFPEKLIPLMIINSNEGKNLPVYGDGKQIRDWIHVSDHANGIILMIEAITENKIQSGEVINFGADNEIMNIDIVKKIIHLTDGNLNQIKYVRDRPGHDRRYAMGYNKAKQILSWEPKIQWEDGIKNTVEWYLSNQKWINSINSGEYREWIKRQYN